jgi:histidinol-phosphate phosphatase family protein
MRKDAVFLDRDGTIIKDKAFLTDHRDIILEDNAAEGIRLLNQLGLKVIIVTNQPHVARGLLSEDEVMGINQALVDMLAKKGAVVDAVYFCPHHPEQRSDIPPHAMKYRIVCECRKPGTGMLRQAAEEHEIDLKKSFMIGDQTMDILSGKNAGCGTILVSTGRAGNDAKHEVVPDYSASDLLEAAKIVRNQNIKVVLLAGGKGERLMPLTKDIPKPMVDIAGKPAMQYHLELAKKYGFDDIVVCTSYMAEKITNYFGDGSGFGVHINYPEEPTPLGSGGAIKNAEKYLDVENFIVLNADVMTDINLDGLVSAHLRNKSLATMVVRYSDHPKDSDVVQMEGDKIVGYIGRGQEEEKIANTGIMVLNRRIIDFIPKGFSNIEKDVVFRLIGKESVCGYLSNAYIKDFGTPERLESVRKRMETA